MATAAIYHFTDGSTCRPKIYQDQIRALEEFAKAKGYDVGEVVCDKSLKRGERKEFNRLLSSADQFDVIITKDLYHISKNTLQCINILKDLDRRGIKVDTLDNGSLVIEDVYPDEPLRAASYCSHYGETRDPRGSIQIQSDILTHYISKKTNWIIEGMYCDEGSMQNHDAQVQLKKLIANSEKYDVVVVNSLNDLDWRTSGFCFTRKALGLDILSLQEGFLRKEGDRK